MFRCKRCKEEFVYPRIPEDTNYGVCPACGYDEYQESITCCSVCEAPIYKGERYFKTIPEGIVYCNNCILEVKE